MPKKHEPIKLVPIVLTEDPEIRHGDYRYEHDGATIVVIMERLRRGLRCVQLSEVEKVKGIDILNQNYYFLHSPFTIGKDPTQYVVIKKNNEFFFDIYLPT